MEAWSQRVVQSSTLAGALVLSAVVLAFLLPAQRADAATFTAFASSAAQVISGASPTETGRPFRGGTSTTCGAPNVPSTLEGATAFHENPYLHTSDLNNSVCVQVTLSTACAGSTSIFAQSYDPSFDPAHINNNYIGDLGSSPPTAASYAFTVGAGHTFIDVVNEVTANAGCAAYEIAWASDLPWNSGPPTLSGNPTAGHPLATSSGTWNGTPALTYQWRRCSATGTSCDDIAGATSSSYTLAAADIGHTLRARVLATNAEGTSSTDTGASAVVAAPAPTTPPVATTSTSPTPPLITGVSQSAAIWRAGHASAQLTRTRKPPIGTTFKFNLDQAATVRLTFTALTIGRRVGKRCNRTTKGNAHKPRCTLRLIAGALSLRAHAGSDKVRFQGRIASSKQLKPGRYTVTITAMNAAGQRSSARTLSFTIVK